MKELIFALEDDVGETLTFKFVNEELCTYDSRYGGHQSYSYNMSEARLLMLYLQEHLK
jgi:hypothetical protein